MAYRERNAARRKDEVARGRKEWMMRWKRTLALIGLAALGLTPLTTAAPAQARSDLCRFPQFRAWGKVCRIVCLTV